MKTPKFIENINWSDLREQKKTLLSLIREFDEEYPESATVVKERLAHLEGILSLIDALQDYAVDEMQIDENIVFDFDVDSDDELYTAGLFVGETIFHAVEKTVGETVDQTVDETVEKTVGETKTIWVCSNCGSDNVQYKIWVTANGQKIADTMDMDLNDSECYCEDCKVHLELYDTTLNADAKVIGFQVVGVEDSKHVGDIHPSMYSGDTLNASNCVYSLSQCDEMIYPAEFHDSFMVWNLLAIWTGDIEKPVMMFEGNPRS
jgi:hypothetical protein